MAEQAKKQDWMKLLKASDSEGTAVDYDYNFYSTEHVVKSTSPSLNWVYGRGNGLPFGLSTIAYGPPKAGKSLIANLFIAGLHRDYPDAIAVKFNTEMREGSQSSKSDLIKWGIDPDRYQGYDTNKPSGIFDKITTEFLPLLEAGMPLKLIIIDSMEGVEGIKAANKESIKDHTIGDHALTIGEGLKRILWIIRKYKIAVICTSHIRANINVVGNPKYAPKTKMAGGYAAKHWFEYYIEVNRDNSSESKATDSDIKDIKGNADITGHRIWCKMAESSVGVAGRTGRFNIDYNKGLINAEEEIFELAKSLNLLERPNNRTYIIGDKKYLSKEEILTAIKNDPEVNKTLLDGIYKDIS